MPKTIIQGKTITVKDESPDQLEFDKRLVQTLDKSPDHIFNPSKQQEEYIIVKKSNLMP